MESKVQESEQSKIRLLEDFSDVTVITKTGQRLRIRQSGHFNDDRIFKADFLFPAEEDLDFENPVIGFQHYAGHRYGVNVVLANGQTSNLKNPKVTDEIRLSHPNVSRVVIHC